MARAIHRRRRIDVSELPKVNDRLDTRAQSFLVIAAKGGAMRQAGLSFRVFAWCVAMTCTALLGACGGDGGGGASSNVAPFWSTGGLIVADFDGDGRIDVAVAAAFVDGPPPHGGHVRIYRQSATGTFGGPIDHAVGPDPWGLSAGDVNGDGRLDLVAATPATAAPQVNVVGDTGGISILRQDPVRPGSFLASQWLDTGGAATDAAIARLTSDDLGDVVVADGVLRNGRALLLAQNPARPGAFLAPVSLQAGSGNGSDDLAVGDVNGDGRADVVLAASSAVAVFYQNAGGGFEPAVLLAAGTGVTGVALGDVDGDGRTDVVVANVGNSPAGGTGGASVTVLRQTIPGTFVGTNVAVADGARRVAIDDLNGDGLPDVVAISLVYQSLTTPSRVSVLLQSPASRGQFAVSGVYDGPYSGNFVATGDVDNDGLNDIVVNDGPTVLLQRASARGTFQAPRPLP
jgi:hypothetical protein